MIKKIILHADDFGRSPNISKSINECIKKKVITSISIIVTEKIYGLKLIHKSRVAKRLHLNLTDFSPKLCKKSKIYKLSFINLLLMPYLPKFIENKKIIKNEIIRQLEIYKQNVSNEISIDGHQHVHVIPWILDIIVDLKNKYKIKTIRMPNEYFAINYEDLFNINILKNLIKFFILKLLVFISLNNFKKFKNKNLFSGIIYSGFQNKKNIIKILKKYKASKYLNNLEILFHPGYASKNEKYLFNGLFYKYFFSKNRVKEFKLCMKINKRKYINEIS
jgi:chitin disaccharide deacetylase